ncbi:MAG: VOC family protein [Methanobacteriota archaeon]|nr:MAG: VOC family protein [Euryarchaeota archaeon]
MVSGKHIPPGFPALVPYLTVDEPERLVAFAKGAFRAEEIEDQHAEHSAGKVVHAALLIEGCVIETGRASVEWKAMPGAIHLYVRDVDAVYDRALKAGGVSLHRVKQMDYGERACAVRDPCGNLWHIATFTGRA